MNKFLIVLREIKNNILLSSINEKLYLCTSFQEILDKHDLEIGSYKKLLWQYKEIARKNFRGKYWLDGTVCWWFVNKAFVNDEIQELNRTKARFIEYIIQDLEKKNSD